MFFVEGILPYIAIAIFVLGTAYRLWAWFKTPVPLNINLAPTKRTWKGAVGKVTAEVVAFTSLFRNDKSLWVIAWSMHIFALIILLGTHFFGLIDAGVDMWTSYTIPGGKVIIYVAALFSFPLIAALLVLLFKRLLTPKVRRITVPTDYVALGLVLAHILGGVYMSFFTELDMAKVMEWGLGLATFHPVIIEGSWIFAVHVTTAFALFMYFPFSKLFHPLGQISNRWTMTQKEVELIKGGRVVKW